jgi:hypothetical protein
MANHISDKIDDPKVDRLLAKMEADYVRPQRKTPPPEQPENVTRGRSSGWRPLPS